MKLSNPGLIYNRVACSIHNSSIRHSILRPSFKLYHSQLDTDQNAATGCNGSEYLIFVTLSEPGGHLALSDFRDCAFSNDFPGAIQSAPGHGVSKFLEAAISIETLRTLAPAMTGFRISGTATSPPPSGVSDQIGPPATYSFPADSGFLIFPLEITCGKGVPCTPYTAKVSTVLDHHVVRTAANPIGYNCQREQLPPGECEDEDFKSKVIAFNGEEGNSEFGTLCFPAGYKMDKDETRFFKNKEINYVATNCGGTKYLKYDGHSGYDFSYDNVPILAAADGILEVPADDPINNPGGSDPKGMFNTLRIIHPNGFETWYLHAKEGSECIPFSQDNSLKKKKACKPADPSRPQAGARVEVKAGDQIGTVGDTGAPKRPHLHFEVRMGADRIVDPYGCLPQVEAIDPSACVGKLWID